MTFIFGVIIGGAGGVFAGWVLLPAPMFVTNWWKRRFGQKELRPLR